MSTFTAGQTTPGASSGLFSGITAVRMTLAQSGILNSISFFSGGVGINMLLGLYSDVGGVPTTLLASSAVTPCVNGLNTLLTTTNPTLSPGNYWLAEQGQSGITGYFDTGGAGAWNNSQAWTGALPTTFPVSGSGAEQFSLYATFTAVVPTPPAGSRLPSQGDNANRSAMKSNSLLYSMKGSPAPPAGSGLTTLAPRGGDTLQLSLKKINAILYVAGGP